MRRQRAERSCLDEDGDCDRGGAEGADAGIAHDLERALALGGSERVGRVGERVDV